MCFNGILDPETRIIEGLSLDGGSYRRQAYDESAPLAAAVLPSLSFKVAEIFG